MRNHFRNHAEKKRFMYEGEDVRDGTYTLGQLSKPRHGRVRKPDSEELYNDMLVLMDDKTFNQLFDYVSSRNGSITQFNAVVVDNEIVHVY